MKKLSIAFSIFLVLSHNLIHAQSYVQFPDSNATWILGFENDYPFDIQYSAASFTVDGDTIINALQYHKVMSDGYFIAYRKLGEDTIMVVPRDSTKEFLLYDFSISIGDTVKVWTYGFTNPGVNQIVCTSISDPFEVSGHMYRQIYFSPQGSWLTGVGGAEGPFSTCYIPSVSGLYFLQCVMTNDSIVYSPFNNCFEVGIQSVFVDTLTQLVPNPVQNLLTIHLPASSSELLIHIYDIQGREMNLPSPKLFSQGTIQLNTSSLVAGFYTLQIINSRTGEKEIAKFVKAQ